MRGPVLDIRDLSVSYHTDRGSLRALRNINMQIHAGRIVGIVGESGCGKSTLISAINRLLARGRLEIHGSPPPASISLSASSFILSFWQGAMFFTSQK